LKNISELEIKTKSLETYVASLETKGNQEREHNENHLTNIDGLKKRLEALVKQKDQEQEHNKNHLKNISELEIKTKSLETYVASLKTQEEQTREHNKNHMKNISELEKGMKALGQQKDQEREHNKNHIKNIKLLEERGTTLEEQLSIEKDFNADYRKQVSELSKKLALAEASLSSERVHNKNHLTAISAWEETASILDGALYDLTDKLKIEQQKSIDLYDNVIKQQAHIVFVEGKEARTINDVQHLEGVLRRVHNKRSYQFVRWMKNTPQKITGVFQRSKVNNEHHGLALEAVPEQETPVRNGHDYGGWLLDHADLADDELRSLAPTISEWFDKPKIAILMPVYNPNESCLVNAIESVLGQIYDNFEFCIADDASTEPYVKDILMRYAEQDKRLKVVFREQNGHISAASNSALTLVESDYVALMDHDDLLTPDALYWVAKTIVQHPEVELIYSDEDKMDLHGNQYGPYFKPD
jgi:hypothetical protein